MTEKNKFVKDDGTLLTGNEAEEELAKHDADKMLKELGLEKGSEDNGTKTNGKDAFIGHGRMLKSAVGQKGSSNGGFSDRASEGNGYPAEGIITLKDSHAGTDNLDDFQGDAKGTDQRNIGVSDLEKSEENELNLKIKDVSPQMESDAKKIWKFSKDAEEGVYKFSLDIDSLWKEILGHVNLIQDGINEIACKIVSHIDSADHLASSGINALDTWGDMAANVKRETERINNTIKEKTGEVTGFTRNLSDRAKSLANSATSVLDNPALKNVADMSGVSDTITDMAGTGEYLCTTFNSFVEDRADNLQEFITSFSQMVIEFGESSGLFGFIKEASSEMSKLLKKLSDLLTKLKKIILGFWGKINGIFEKIFTCVATIRSVIGGVLGLDLELMKEALKNGTIRATDVKVGTIRVAGSTEVKTKSSTDITGAKVTVGNVSAVGTVTDNSKSGHIEVAAVDIKAGNVDAALMRKGKFKRNLAYLKGAGVNVGNVRATMIDDREGDTTVVGASAAEINVGNVEAFGLGRKGTHTHTTAQASLNVGNVAVGIRRSTGTNLRVGPQLSAFNVDLTVGAPSVSNFLNQLNPLQGFGNIAIPFLGGGGGEAGGKGSGERGSGMPLETAGESTYGLARDTGEFGDRLPQDGGEGGVGIVKGPDSNPQGGSGCDGGRSGSGELQELESDDKSGSGQGNGSRTLTRGEDGIMRVSRNHGGVPAGQTSSSGHSGNIFENQNDLTQPGSSRSAHQNIRNTSQNGNNSGTAGGQETGPDRGVSALGSGVYKTGDNLGEKREQDYQSKLRSIVKGQVNDKIGKKPKKDQKDKKPPEKKKNLDKDEIKRMLFQECRDELLEAETSGGGGAAGTGVDGEKIKKKAKPKPKAKPWGEHGNIHGFSTLGTESEKEVKKLGEDIYGFGTAGGQETGPDRGVSALGSGVYKTGDNLGEKREQDYQSKLRSIVKGQVNDKIGKKPKKDQKDKKTPEKKKNLDKDEIKRMLFQECQDELLEAETSGGGGAAGTGVDGEKIKKKAKPKPKAKPWGEHGNIHGFRTLGTESEKEVKKLGEDIYGFGDG